MCRLAVAMFAVLASASSHSAGQREMSTDDASETRVYKVIGDVELRAFIYRPDGHSSGDNRAAMVFFHGGGWRQGSPGQFAPHCRVLADEGMVAITVQYRLTDVHGVPAWRCLEDALSAMRWVRGHANELGIDPGRIAAGGGSAGGQLAACAGLGVEGFDADTDDLSVSSRANALVLFNPALNIAKIPDTYGWQGRSGKASPQQLVAEGAPPSIVFHGTEDRTVRHTQAVMFQETMEAAGNRCELISYEGEDHGFFNADRRAANFRDTTQKMVAFLRDLGFIQ